MVPLPYSHGLGFRYSDRSHDSSITILICFPPTASLPFIYDLNGFKSRINRHLLTVGSF